ncbi:type VII secretion target [Mycolicibacterium stellerae]|uniref:type VII secretion target n=1 Tax=Mycolicibacterium stellerae TaxID=2358193 RepID=UPI000F0BA5D3|nr:type VII secretion target [Mycolicibacterium stellerae]
MGEPDTARVDVAAVLDAARQYDTAADIVDAAIRTHLTGLRFDGAVAGRIHTAHGDALRLAIDELVHRLHQWARAATEIAAELRSCADRYVDVDDRGARRIG